MKTNYALAYDDLIAAYDSSDITEQELLSSFRLLVYKLSIATKTPLPEDVEEEFAQDCLSRLDRFNRKTGKGKALNYFTTFTLCLLKQYRHRRGNYWLRY